MLQKPALCYLNFITSMTELVSAKNKAPVSLAPENTSRVNMKRLLLDVLFFSPESCHLLTCANAVLCSEQFL